MCKYCKRLKELKDLDKKSYDEIIHFWKLRDKKARDLVSYLYIMLISDGANTRFIHKQVVDFLDCKYIGK